tara:strand:- start:412 stop:663 length:252 start_codon:yes stop_codon:yes gene_type:complete
MKHFDEHTYMLQSYYVITNQVGYEQLLNRDMKVTLIFDPTRDVIEDHEEVFDQLIEYFENLEEYEKCADLLNSKNLMSELQVV